MTVAVSETVARFGRLDVLVTNAGIIQVGPPDAMTHDDYERAMRVHFWGPFHTINAVLPYLRMIRGGRIANVSSIGGRISVPHLLPYCAAQRIVAACRRGDAELRLPSWAAAVMAGHAVFPGLGTRAVAAAESLLPDDVDGAGMVEGRDVPPRISRSVLTVFGRRAAARNNESTREA